MQTCGFQSIRFNPNSWINECHAYRFGDDESKTREIHDSILILAMDTTRGDNSGWALPGAPSVSSSIVKPVTACKAVTRCGAGFPVLGSAARKRSWQRAGANTKLFPLLNDVHKPNSTIVLMASCHYCWRPAMDRHCFWFKVRYSKDFEFYRGLAYRI